MKLVAILVKKGDRVSQCPLFLQLEKTVMTDIRTLVGILAPARLRALGILNGNELRGLGRRLKIKLI